MSRGKRWEQFSVTMFYLLTTRIVDDWFYRFERFIGIFLLCLNTTEAGRFFLSFPPNALLSLTVMLRSVKDT